MGTYLQAFIKDKVAYSFQAPVENRIVFNRSFFVLKMMFPGWLAAKKICSFKI
jgi:hypothetical protein